MAAVVNWLSIVLVFQIVNTEASYNFTYQVAHQCKEFDCRHGYLYDNFFHIDDHKHIKKQKNAIIEMHLAILAASNGHILLSTKASPQSTDPVYEIVVGGGSNKFTELRRNLRRNAKASMKTIGILSAIEFRAFYIRIDEDGTIEFGRENETLPILSYFDVNPLPIKYFSFAAWNGVEAKFLYDCPAPGDASETTPDSAPVAPKLSNSDQLKVTLLQGRDPFTPPEEQMKVKISITITDVKYNAFENTLKTGLSVVLRWTDENMAWDPEKFSNISSVKFFTGQIWTPTFFVDNADTVTPLDTKWSDDITMNSNGEATHHFHTETTTLFYDVAQEPISKWPRDEYYCFIIIKPWEAHEDIRLEIMFRNETDLNLFKDVDQEIRNEWEIKSDQVVNTPTELVIRMKLTRNATAYNIAFYTPLLVIMTFVLMSFWSEPLQLSRIWFYIGVTITIVMGLCYMDTIVPVHAVPSIFILYSTILNAVLVALVLQVLLMTDTAESLCKTSFVTSLLTSKITTTVFCLPALKNCQTYESFNEVFASQEDEHQEDLPRGASVEQMDRDQIDPASERVLVANCLDKTMFVVYSIIIAVLLALHF